MILIILCSLVGLVALVLVLALFTTKNYLIKREITINKSDSVVYDYLSHLKNHRHFNKWLKTDPNMRETFSGTDGSIGFVYAYEGNKEVGAGELEIKGLTTNKNIEIELRFIRPFKSISNTPYELYKISDNQTKVKWTMQGTFNYPKNIALLFIDIDKFLGRDVQSSLEDLKKVLEQ